MVVQFEIHLPTAFITETNNTSVPVMKHHTNANMAMTWSGMVSSDVAALMVGIGLFLDADVSRSSYAPVRLIFISTLPSTYYKCYCQTK